MNQSVLDFTTPKHKLYRPEAPDTSKEAAFRVDAIGDEERVYHHIQAAGERGLTIKECSALMGKFPNQISGRFTSLQEKHYIEDSGRRRGKSRVMVAVPQKEAA